jgi:hypothetical protein
MTRMMQERGVQMQAEQLPISAIVRCPLLAIRWQLSNKKVTTNDASCNTITNGIDSSYSSQIQVQHGFRHRIPTTPPVRSSYERIDTSPGAVKLKIPIAAACFVI